jgi:hypothetical protein
MEDLLEARLKFKNVIAIAGLETLKDANGKPYKWAATFMNNVETWIKDVWNKKAGGKAVAFDARNYKMEPNPLDSLMKAVLKATQAMPDGLDAMLYTGHGDMEAFYVFSKTRTELPDTSRFIMMDMLDKKYLDQLKWSQNQKRGIWLATCRAGGDNGKKLEHCIAQSLANWTQVPTWGFLCRCSQKQRQDGGYYQKPDRGSYVEFRPAAQQQIETTNDIISEKN